MGYSGKEPLIADRNQNRCRPRLTQFLFVLVFFAAIYTTFWTYNTRNENKDLENELIFIKQLVRNLTERTIKERNRYILQMKRLNESTGEMKTCCSKKNQEELKSMACQSQLAENSAKCKEQISTAVGKMSNMEHFLNDKLSSCMKQLDGDDNKNTVGDSSNKSKIVPPSPFKEQWKQPGVSKDTSYRPPAANKTQVDNVIGKPNDALVTKGSTFIKEELAKDPYGRIIRGPQGHVVISKTTLSTPLKGISVTGLANKTSLNNQSKDILPDKTGSKQPGNKTTSGRLEVDDFALDEEDFEPRANKNQGQKTASTIGGKGVTNKVNQQSPSTPNDKSPKKDNKKQKDGDDDEDVFDGDDY